MYDLLDIDECEELRPCSINAMCNNTFGSYQCTCNKGFYGNGAVCTGINVIPTCMVSLALTVIYYY